MSVAPEEVVRLDARLSVVHLGSGQTLVIFECEPSAEVVHLAAQLGRRCVVGVAIAPAEVIDG